MYGEGSWGGWARMGRGGDYTAGVKIIVLVLAQTVLEPVQTRIFR